jgi:hypothetical protein
MDSDSNNSNNNSNANGTSMPSYDQAIDMSLQVSPIKEELEPASPPQQPQANTPLDTNTNTTTHTTTTTRRRKKQYAVSTAWEKSLAENRAPADIHTYFCCCATRLGNMFRIYAHNDGTPIILAGPCWPFCVSVTLPMILGLSGSVAYFMIYLPTFQLPQWLLVVYLPLIGLTLLALACVSCRDPGLMERVTDEEAGEGGWFWNEQVGSYRPPGALYCRECGVLIQDYDHLCPWTGTAIGVNNMRAFKVFVVSVNLLCYASIGIVAWGFLQGLLST